MENLDLTKILKVGDKVYSPMIGECEVSDIDSNCEWGIKVYSKYCNESFTKEGKYSTIGECLLFPSKENRDWSTFKRVESYEDIVNKIDIGISCNPPISFCSEAHLTKTIAINKLLIVAKYLNGDWKPDWKDTDECKYYLVLDVFNIPMVRCHYTQCSVCYFKTKELAQQAIDILGEETIKTALGDY